ncbi:MAG: phosphotransferase [Planctomycetes bacterium]|nr:phosphotransferase [Planctomycetota bacterium]
MILSAPIDPIARSVLEFYPPEAAESSWAALGNAGGFSGARLWRGETADGRQLCLRAWPFARMKEDRLNRIHRAIAACHLPFVPELIETTEGNTWLHAKDVFWEMTTWLPGQADFHKEPSDARLFAAMRAVAAIHRRWTLREPLVAPCPAVRRILRALREWRNLLQSGWRPDFDLPLTPEIHQCARRAWDAVFANIFGTEFALHDWEKRPLPVQVCLCDVWHDHILFEGENVTGVIDYGGVKPDCVAVDLARLLGSLLPDQPERMQNALDVYTAVNPLPSEILKLVPVLDRCGSVVGLTNWLRWLYLDRKAYEDLPRVAERLEMLLQRVETSRPANLFPWA